MLQCYVDINAGGTPHTNDEIERIKKMIQELGWLKYMWGYRDE